MANDDERSEASPTAENEPTFSGSSDSASQPPEAASGTSNRGSDDAASPPSPSEQFGRYRIVRPIAEGTMGAVFLAEDMLLERAVALKIPKLVEPFGDDLRARFAREAKCAAALSHPQICPVYDVGEIDGKPYLAMAYIEGRPLSEVAAELIGNRAAVVSLIRELATTLQFAHEAGVLHRDLKPANVMIDRQGRSILTDFGLARKLNGDMRLTQTGVMIGTPAYMPLEQACGEAAAIGPASDVYSLGVIFYELLTGALPFTGDSHFDLLRRLLDEDPEPLRQRVPDIDPELEAVCLKMMAKRACDRYQSMQEVADALDRLAQPYEPRVFAQSATLVPGTPSHHGGQSDEANQRADNGPREKAHRARRTWKRVRLIRRSIPRAGAVLPLVILGATLLLLPGRLQPPSTPILPPNVTAAAPEATVSPPANAAPQPAAVSSLATAGPRLRPSDDNELPALVETRSPTVVEDSAEARILVPAPVDSDADNLEGAGTVSESTGAGTAPASATSVTADEPMGAPERQEPRRWYGGIILGKYRNPEFHTNERADDTFRHLSEALQTRGRFQPLEQLILINEEATGARVRDALARLPELTRPGDTLLLALNAFAVPLPSRPGEQPAGLSDRREVFALYDSSLKRRDSLLLPEELARVLAKLDGRRIVVLLDFDVPIARMSSELLARQRQASRPRDQADANADRVHAAREQLDDAGANRDFREYVEKQAEWGRRRIDGRGPPQMRHARVTTLPLEQQRESVLVAVSKTFGSYSVSGDYEQGDRGRMLTLLQAILNDERPANLCDALDWLEKDLWHSQIGVTLELFRLEGDAQFTKQIDFSD